MSDWVQGTLSDTIAALDAGVSVNAEDRPHGAGEIGVLKTSAVSGGRFYPDQNKSVVPHERRLVAEQVKADSILVSRMNTPALVGESCYVEDAHSTLFLPDRLWQLKPKDRTKLNMRWLSFILQSAEYRHYVEVHATGTSGSMKNLPKAKLLALPVTYPEPIEQARIAEVLDTLESIVRETEAIIAKLKLIKQGQLHDLLTRGIDENGELRPPRSSAPHLYKESPLGWIPREWDVCCINEVGESITGNTPPSHDPLAWGADGTPFITPGDIEDERPIADADRHVTQRGLNYVRLLPPRSTLVVCIGSTIGKVGITALESCTNQQINAVIPKNGMDPEFLFLAMQMNVGQLRALAGLQAVPIVNKSSFESICIPRPPHTEQLAISSRMIAISTRLHNETRVVGKLRQERTGLMDDLLTGQIRVLPLLAQKE
ncbi:restriction endonuclease subunit S [Paraburkholderia nemoris]|uniref:restriction endonuclease subunit S n=1 Tax=Paraburkholderia nemoris TaxID=2793076 RepID=UPI001B0124C7|nr:restriction endonuclease subunit S [Paraburkholderia nemoris]CAE6828565.1 hypothetical protein LMG22931_06689 [Paraburkholderia nemoris]